MTGVLLGQVHRISLISSLVTAIMVNDVSPRRVNEYVGLPLLESRLAHRLAVGREQPVDRVNHLRF